MNNGDCGEVKKMGFDLNTLHQRTNEIEETASYAVALAEAVRRAVDDLVGPEPENDSDKQACESPQSIDKRISSSNYVIMYQLKEISKQLERL